MASVWSQALNSASDDTLIEVCRVEERVLVSLDRDFTNTLRFPPARYAGIIVLRMPEPLRREGIESALRRVTVLASTRDPKQRLWIVTTDRIREFAASDPL